MCSLIASQLSHTYVSVISVFSVVKKMDACDEDESVVMKKNGCVLKSIFLFFFFYKRMTF